MITKFLILFALAALAQSLELEGVEEGSCIPVESTVYVNQTWLASTYLPYLSGGSKYHLYRVSSQHPRFPKMRESEFYYKSCLQNYFSVKEGNGAIYGFGDGIIGNFLVQIPDDLKNTIDFIPIPTPGLKDVSRHTISMTDNKSFILFVNCWMGSDQRGWDLVTTTPYLDQKTQKLIEEHLVSLGFDSEQFVFLKYDHCDSPVPGSIGKNRFRSEAGIQERRYRSGKH